MTLAAASDEFEPVRQTKRKAEGPLLAKGGPAYQPEIIPGTHASWLNWQCQDDTGPTGHPEWREAVVLGRMPTCPTCGSHRALPVAASTETVPELPPQA